MNETSDRVTSAQCDAPCDRYGWAAVLRNTLPFFLLLTTAPFLHARSAWLSWSLAPLIGLFAYRMTIVMHDCTHRTLFVNPKLNVRVGKALGAITGIDFERFSTQHLHFNYHEEHHRRPQCSSCHLPAMHHASGDASHELPRRMFGTIAAMLTSRRSNHA
jgi:fatty acid desaturase